MNSIKKFLSKHSFIVIFAVAIIIALANFLVYPVFINGSMGYIEVPVAKATIPEGTLITEDMLDVASVTEESIPRGIYLNKEGVVGKFVKAGNAIPTGGYFSTEQIADEQQTFGTIYENLKEGEWAYTLVVPARYNLGAAFRESQLIDIYFYAEIKMVDAEGGSDYRTYNAPVFGMIAENRRIVGLADAGDSEYVTIACSEEDVEYLTIAERMGEVFPLVYYGSSGLVDAETKVYDISALRNWIDERASEIFVTDLLERYDLLGLSGDIMIQSIQDRDDIDPETYDKIVEAINELNGVTEELPEEPEVPEEPAKTTAPAKAPAKTPAKTTTPAKTPEKTETTAPKTEEKTGARMG